MAQVTIHSRDRSLVISDAGQTQEVVALTYSTLAVSPRIVNLPLDLYRPATADELAANPRYQMLPVDERAVDTERQLIQADMKGYISLAPERFELP